MPIVPGVPPFTYFDDTPLLSPSSLAFFVSGFSKISTETRSGIVHDVSVRETEMKYTDLLISTIEQILESTHSYMNFDLPVRKLQSVVLPNYQQDMGSFFGFINYQLGFNFNKVG